jgi:transcription initiation factor TFIIIB Brf1 subunit/transcription initiation factor TFIIB
MKCIECGKEVEYNNVHNDVVCKNKDCVLFEEAIDIRDYVDDLVAYEKSTKDFLNKQIDSWKNKYKILLESKIKSLDK